VDICHESTAAILLRETGDSARSAASSSSASASVSGIASANANTGTSVNANASTSTSASVSASSRASSSSHSTVGDAFFSDPLSFTTDINNTNFKSKEGDEAAAVASTKPVSEDGAAKESGFSSRMELAIGALVVEDSSGTSDCASNSAVRAEHGTKNISPDGRASISSNVSEIHGGEIDINGGEIAIEGAGPTSNTDNVNSMRVRANRVKSDVEANDNDNDNDNGAIAEHSEWIVASSSDSNASDSDCDDEDDDSE
jgi:hypothetical protein